MIDDILAKFDGAFAKNTIRAYRSDFIQYPQLQTPWSIILTTLPPSGEVQLSGEESIAWGRSQTLQTLQPHQPARGHIGHAKNAPKKWTGTAASYSTHEAATQPAT